MLEKVLDLHIHSRYSRACSPQLVLPNIAKACTEKGIDIVATGDYTHPGWFAHIKESLEEVGESGLYRLKIQNLKSQFPNKSKTQNTKTLFILSTEVSCIYKHKDKTRRLHLVLLAPNIKAVERLNQKLTERGINLKSDGRPILGMSAKELLKIVLDIDKRFLVIPAHAWTPWFAVFGSKSGYDSLEDCFEEFSPNIRAIETGLSSDPTMNHRLSKLDKITLVSNSDAHSLDNLGREANVFNFAKNKITYDEIVDIIKSGDKKRFLYTIEFYPEEGMYYADGHATCKICWNPEKSKQNNNVCPVCKKTLIIGVLHRIDDLADRSEKDILIDNFIPHKYIVPLREIIGKVFGVGKKSKKVEKEYYNLIKNIGNEFYILLHSTFEDISKVASNKNIAVAIINMRIGAVKISPGYDGVYGVVEPILNKSKKKVV